MSTFKRKIKKKNVGFNMKVKRAALKTPCAGGIFSDSTVVHVI